MKHRIAAAGAALALLMLTTAPVSADSMLSGTAIRALFPGSYHAQAGGYTMTIRGSGNGALEGRAILGFMRDRGRWWVAADQLCIAFTEWLGGKPKCGQIRKVGQWYTASLGGGHDLKFKPSL